LLFSDPEAGRILRAAGQLSGGLLRLSRLYLSRKYSAAPNNVPATRFSRQLSA